MSVINTPGGISNVVIPPSNYEIAQPFHIDSTGGVAVLTDPVQAAIQHLLMIALTNPGERVMRPSYGAGLSGLVFASSPMADFSRAAAILQDAYNQYDGGFASVQVSVQQQDVGTYVFSVTFTLDQDPTIHQAVFDYAGNLIGTR